MRLVIVINAMDELLNNFKASKENTSILFAAHALEVFVKSFAKRQLTAANDTFMQSGKQLGTGYYMIYYI